MKKLAILLLLAASTLLASIGEVSALRGSGELVRGDMHKKIILGTQLEVHDVITTDKASKVQLVFKDKTVISLGQNSHFKVDDYLFDEKKPSAKFSITKGFFKSITGKIGKIAPKKFKVKTANATIGVRGTTIVAEVSAKRDIIACSFGQIVVSTDRGEVLVNAGERTIVEETKAPRQAQKVNAIILKELDKKSNPSVQSTKDTPRAKQMASDGEKSISQETTQVKEADSLDPWTKERPDQTLDDIQNVVGEPKPRYEGKVVEGRTSFGAIDKESSKVNLGFDLGAGTMDGNLDFKDSTHNNYDIDVAGKVNGDGSFDFNSNNGYDGGGSGALSGKSLEKAKGDFGFSEQDMLRHDINHIDGKFEATHKK